MFTSLVYQEAKTGTPLAVHWLRLHASTAGGVGSIPGQGTKIPHVAQCSQNNIKQLAECSVEFNKVIRSTNIYSLWILTQICTHATSFSL